MPNLLVPAPPTVAPGLTVSGAFWNANVRDAFNFLLNPPLCVLQQNTTQSMQNITNTAIKFQATIVDSYNGFNFATGTYYAPVPGWYQCIGAICYASNATGGRIAAMAVNAPINASGAFTNPGAVNAANGAMITTPARSGDFTNLTVTNYLWMAAGDYVQLYGFQNSGGALSTFQAAYAYSSFQIMWVHA